ncbi:MAG TPA: MaoC family dehydratase [Gaiellaceae bacterium]|jgi:acyl dehydratase|nr:MaoC family dehydratase [Gaiellaceae bacterium]
MGRKRRPLGADVIEAGAELPPSPWLTIEQSRIDAFADATEDRQSIHVDPELAAAGPFGTTVAHGFLTLSLLVHLWNQVAPSRNGVTVNYGLNRVRFPAPVPAGSRIRGRFRVESVEEVDGGKQATVAATVEREGAEKPVCVAALLLRFLD